VCKNDCILYHGAEYEDLEKCPISGLDRFNRTEDDGDDEKFNKRKGKPKKVFWYFFYHSLFEALVYKQKGVRIIVMTQREA
jgi:hypothetical protein